MGDKKRKEYFVAGLKVNPQKTIQCKHCGSPSQFVQEITVGMQTSEWYACPECRGMTQIKI